MELSAVELIERYQSFTKKSLLWCTKESEDSTSRVSDAVELLLQNTSRVSELSEESIVAIEGLHRKIKVHLKNKTDSSLKDLIVTLKNLASENNEIKNVIHPIIESLQFQDRLRQNLENIAAMIPAWLKKRESYKTKGIGEQDLLEMGTELMKLTTMASERDIIRSKIDGLPDTEVKETTLMF